MPTGPASPEAPQSLLDLLQGLPRARPQASLKPFGELLEERTASPWWASLDALKITGSNGKGSVAALVASMLSACGICTGLTTSPHIRSFHERIAVDGVPVSNPSLDAAGAILRRHLARVTAGGERILAFEATTFLAIEVFANAGVEAVVAEAGIGGRDDATRLLPGTTHGLVSVDGEHLELLGGDLEQVALNKAHLAEPGGALLLGELPEDLERTVLEESRRRGVDVVTLHPGLEVGEVTMDGGEMVFDLTVDDSSWRDLRCGLLGRHQAVNCALAVRLAKHWLERNRPELVQTLADRVPLAIARVRLPGRCQRVWDDPPVWVDTAHTPAAMEALARAVPNVRQGPWVWVVGVSSDKSPESLLTPLLLPGCVEPVHVVASQADHRGGDPQRIARAMSALAPQIPCSVESSLPHALDGAMARARELGAGVLVAGGLFLASEAMEHLAPSADPLPLY